MTILEEVKEWSQNVFQNKMTFCSSDETRYLSKLRERLIELEEAEQEAHEIRYMLAEWVTPQKSVAPGPRCSWKMSEVTKAKIKKNIAKLKPLSSDFISPEVAMLINNDARWNIVARAMEVIEQKWGDAPSPIPEEPPACKCDLWKGCTCGAIVPYKPTW